MAHDRFTGMFKNSLCFFLFLTRLYYYIVGNLWLLTRMLDPKWSQPFIAFSPVIFFSSFHFGRLLSHLLNLFPQISHYILQHSESNAKCISNAHRRWIIHVVEWRRYDGTKTVQKQLGKKRNTEGRGSKKQRKQKTEKERKKWSDTQRSLKNDLFMFIFGYLVSIIYGLVIDYGIFRISFSSQSQLEHSGCGDSRKCSSSAW